MKKWAILFISFLSVAFGFEVDINKSEFTWIGKKLGGEHTGKIKLVAATPLWKRYNLGTFVMDMNSMTVTDLSGEKATGLLNHLKSDDFFSVKKYPVAVLQITTHRPMKGKKMHEVRGMLTIKGITQPVDFKYSKDGKKLMGSFVFNRALFAVKYGSKSWFKSIGDKVIYDDITINFTLHPQTPKKAPKLSLN